MQGLRAVLILAMSACGASAALAQEAPVAADTAATAPAAASTSTTSTSTASTAAATPAASAPIGRPGGDRTADQIADWMKSAPAAADPNAPQDGDAGPRQIHGEVGLEVSNRGYGGYAAASMPIGEASELDVAVSGAHERLPHGGSVNPRSISIGLYLDGRDVGNWLSHDKCQQHTGVRLHDDPVLLADGACVKPSEKTPPGAAPGS